MAWDSTGAFRGVRGRVKGGTGLNMWPMRASLFFVNYSLAGVGCAVAVPAVLCERRGDVAQFSDYGPDCALRQTAARVLV
jgi:hypothetical protein